VHPLDCEADFFREALEVVDFLAELELERAMTVFHWCRGRARRILKM
jgi:hypothetical protein